VSHAVQACDPFVVSRIGVPWVEQIGVALSSSCLEQ
jgi:hypothetical protein